MSEKNNDLIVALGKKIPTKPSIASDFQEATTAEDKSTEVADKVMSESPEVVKKISIVEMAYEYLSSVYSFIEVDEQLFVYKEDNGYWEFVDENNDHRALRRLIDRNMRVKISNAGLKDVYECLVTDAPHYDSDIFEKSSMHYINFKDVALNWRSGDTVTNRKNLYFRYCLTINYPVKKSTGKFMEFINDVFRNDEHETATISEFSKLFGLALSDIRGLKSAYMLYGPSNTSKSVMLNLLRNLVGNAHCSAVSFSQINSEFSVARLFGKRLNLSGEVSGATTTRLDIFKSLCGNDLVMANRKNISQIDFKCRCLLIFGANTLPSISNPEEFEAFISRIYIFPFLNVVPRSKWDQNLLEKLLEDEKGIIDFAVKGLKRLKEDNFKIKETKAMKAIKREYNGISDSFTLFINRYIVEEKNSQLTSDEITTAYKRFCTVNDYPELSSNKYLVTLQRRFRTEKAHLQNPVTKKTQRGYKHLAFSKHIHELMGESGSFEKSIEEAIFNNQEE